MLARPIKTAAACFALMLLGACASRGGEQEVAINTVPPGAICEVERAGLAMGRIESTPGVIAVKPEREGLTIACRKQGFIKTIFFDKAEPANGLSNGGIGFAMNAIAGQKWAYPSPVTITLLKPVAGY